MWLVAGYEIRQKAAPVASEFDWKPSPRATVSVLASSSQLVACRQAAVVQAVVPLASRRWEVLPAG